MKLSKQKIESLAFDFTNRAKQALKARQYDLAIRYIKCAAHTKYNFYLGFKDDELEAIIDELSSKLYQIQISNYSDKVCVFFDSFSIDNAGLVHQYLSALNYAGFEIVYITEKIGFKNIDSTIKNQLLSYNKSKIIELPNTPISVKRCQLIYETILRTNASRVFMHIGPSSVCPIVAFNALPKCIVKFKINLTDHTFWLGTNCVDYSLEFRTRGCILTECQRKIPRDHIFLIPFYPAQSKAPFQGFPVETKNKVIILSGGAYYKIFDVNDTYFKIVKSILDNNKSAVVIFAGTGDTEKMMMKIREYSLLGRFYLIGHRSDITEVFKNSDIYLNTTPISGGLMCQLSAMNSKPILSFNNSGSSKVEEFVCQRKFMNISHSTIESLVDESIRFVEDKEYRIEIGKALHECIVDEEQFNLIFVDTINNNKNQTLYQFDKSMDYNYLRIEDKINYENTNKFYHRTIVKIFGWSSIWRCPLFLFESAYILLKRLIVRNYFS